MRKSAAPNAVRTLEGRNATQDPQHRRPHAFELAACHESFTRAAKIFLTHPERDLQTDRRPEGFLGCACFAAPAAASFTGGGASYSRQISARFDAVERDTLSVMAHHGPGATIELAVMLTFATRWLMPRLTEFSARAGHHHQPHPRTCPFLFAETEFDAALYFGDAGWLAPRRIFDARRIRCRAAPGWRRWPQPGRGGDRGAAPVGQSTRPYAWRQWFGSFGMQPVTT